MPDTPDTTEYEFTPATPSDPYWKNEAMLCLYYSEIGVQLGYVKLGEGTARHLWFGYVGNDTMPVTPGGRTSREEAKSDVVRMHEVAVGLNVAEMEFRAEQRRQP